VLKNTKNIVSKILVLKYISAKNNPSKNPRKNVKNDTKKNHTVSTAKLLRFFTLSRLAANRPEEPVSLEWTGLKKLEIEVRTRTLKSKLENNAQNRSSKSKLEIETRNRQSKSKLEALIASFDCDLRFCVSISSFDFEFSFWVFIWSFAVEIRVPGLSSNIDFEFRRATLVLTY